MPDRVKTRAPAAPRGRATARALDVVWDDGPLVRGALAAALDASPSAITAALHELEAVGIVADAGPSPSTGGRPPRIIDLSPALGVVLAADVGAINIRVAAADARGRVLVRETLPTPASSDPGLFRAALTDGLARVAAGREPVLAIALGVAAIVDPATGRPSLATVPGWPAADPAEWLGRFGAPLAVENEANLAAVGERAHGCARGARDVLFVAVGAGVGAGLVLDGALYRGAHGAAGEIGFLRRSLTPPPAQLELEAAAGATVRRYRQAGGDADVVGAHEVFERAARGEEAASSAVNGAIDELALGIANAIAVLNPELVVVGGGFGSGGAELVEPLRERIERLVPVVPRLAASELGPDAALVGAAVRGAELARRAVHARLADGTNA